MVERCASKTLASGPTRRWCRSPSPHSPKSGDENRKALFPEPAKNSTFRCAAGRHAPAGPPRSTAASARRPYRRLVEVDHEVGRRVEIRPFSAGGIVDLEQDRLRPRAAEGRQREAAALVLERAPARRPRTHGPQPSRARLASRFQPTGRSRRSPPAGCRSGRR